MRRYVVDYAVKLVKGLRRLRIKIYVTAEIQRLDAIQIGHNDGTPVGLPDEAKHLGMAGFAENNNLGVRV